MLCSKGFTKNFQTVAVNFVTLSESMLFRFQKYVMQEAYFNRTIQTLVFKYFLSFGKNVYNDQKQHLSVPRNRCVISTEVCVFGRVWNVNAADFAAMSNLHYQSLYVPIGTIDIPVYEGLHSRDTWMTSTKIFQNYFLKRCKHYQQTSESRRLRKQCYHQFSISFFSYLLFICFFSLIKLST